MLVIQLLCRMGRSSDAIEAGGGTATIATAAATNTATAAKRKVNSTL